MIRILIASICSSRMTKLKGAPEDVVAQWLLMEVLVNLLHCCYVMEEEGRVRGSCCELEALLEEAKEACCP